MSTCILWSGLHADT